MNRHQRVLFLEPDTITKSENIRVTVNAPIKREIVVVPDREWENGFLTFYTSVIEEDGILKMWYTCRDKEMQGNLAYAESRDGVHWEKPELHIREYRGSTKNNFVGIPNLDGSVFLDETAPGSERYKYISGSPEGLTYYTSPDGIEWNPQQNIILPFDFDTQNICFWDPNINQYVFFLRGWKIISADEFGNRRRFVVRATLESMKDSVDIRPAGALGYVKKKTIAHVTCELPKVFGTDAYDPPESDVYTMAAMPYPLDTSYYIAFPTSLNRIPHPPGSKITYPGRSEVWCIGSGDGIRWHRFNREPYVKPGLEGSHGSNMVFAGQGMIVRGDEIWQYGTGYATIHGDKDARIEQKDGVIYRFTQRLDGFVSADADYRGGELETCPVECRGEQLIINVDTGASGSVRVAVLDEEGKVIPGHAMEECVRIQTNNVRCRVKWHRTDSLGLLKGRNIRIRIAGSSFKLYSIYTE